MKLIEWADLKKLYKCSRRRPNKLLFKRENIRRLWPMWATVASTIPLTTFAGFGIKYPILIPFAYLALVPWAIALYSTRFKALRMVYPQQFADHAIDRQSWREKENVLCYAFFLEAMRDEGYTATQLRELSAYSDLTGKPPRPALSQNLGFASLIALMIALAAEAIKVAPIFTSKGSVVLMLGFIVLGIYGTVLDGIHSLVYEKGWIKRYLDLAAFDIEEFVHRDQQLNFEAATQDSQPTSHSLHSLDAEVRAPVSQVGEPS
ncbi:hypothetical protein ACIOZM_05160 [Pseudomonas sp. NPDC087346]|uniref:hypothetical protein n=1 Tax=Pseudomonas sp. NPDC087346 TaxID=3364438 RepID=UPI003824B7AE